TDSGNGASSTQVAADQAAVTAAQNQVTNAQNALAEATLTSPITGTVASVNLTVGQQVSGSSGSTGSSAGSGSTGGTGGAGAGGAGGTSGAGTGSTGTGTGTGSSTDQIVVISNGSYVVNASVDDTQVGQVKVGDQAVITPNSGTTTAFGTVTSVALLASSSSSVPSYPVTIGVTGSPTGLYPGASASVQIIVKQLTNALVIPASALHFTNGKVTVLKLVSGKQTSVTVTTGMTQGGQIQILSGLADGDQVVTPGTTRTAGAGGAGAGTGRTGAGGGFGGAGGFGGGGGFGGAGGLGGGGGGGAAPPVRVGG
ncbi:MAG TPA: RND transporter, partial [Pseudonocardiaceae bacterium]|nr:RND transporter [Pseudonocardiaceae bacterium]